MKSIKIGNEEFKIKYISNDEINEISKQMGFKDVHMVYDGLCNHRNNTIYINKDLEEERRKQVIYHECVHMIGTVHNDDMLDMLNSEEGYVRWQTSNRHLINQVYKQIYEK